MTRSAMAIGCRVLLLLGVVGCAEPAGPGPGRLRHGYQLRAIDGQITPVELPGVGLLVGIGLAFSSLPRPRSEGVAAGVVVYSTLVHLPNQFALKQEIRHLNYAVDYHKVSIDLCPPPSSCLVPTALIGSVVAGGTELVLTHYLNGRPGAVYHFFPTVL